MPRGCAPSGISLLCSFRRSWGLGGLASHKPNRSRASRQASSPGSQARQTSGRTSYIAHDVATPTSPNKAAQRSPSHCMRPRRWSAYARGMRSRALSSSVVKRGQSREYEQQAPQLRQSEAASVNVSAVQSISILERMSRSHGLRPIHLAAAAELPSGLDGRPGSQTGTETLTTSGKVGQNAEPVSISGATSAVMGYALQCAPPKLKASFGSGMCLHQHHQLRGRDIRWEKGETEGRGGGALRTTSIQVLP